MGGISNEVLNASNVNFSATNDFTPSVTADGQLLIGSSVAPNIRVSTLQAGTGIAIANGNGTISIAATGGGQAWTATASSSVAMSKDVGYIATGASLQTFTIPATAAVGDTFLIAGFGTGGWVLQANAGQTVRVGNVVTSTAGTIASSDQGDIIEIVCAVANTSFIAISVWGNPSYT